MTDTELTQTTQDIRHHEKGNIDAMFFGMFIGFMIGALLGGILITVTAEEPFKAAAKHCMRWGNFSIIGDDSNEYTFKCREYEVKPKPFG